MKIEEMSVHQVLSIKQVLEIVGIGRVTLWRLFRDGRGPKKTKIGCGRGFGVTAGDLIEWLESRKC